jgi:hypothetical protein
MKAPKSMGGSNTQKRKCALCENLIPADSELSICTVCISHADCCVGLENLHGE